MTSLTNIPFSVPLKEKKVMKSEKRKQVYSNAKSAKINSPWFPSFADFAKIKSHYQWRHRLFASDFDWVSVYLHFDKEIVFIDFPIDLHQRNIHKSAKCNRIFIDVEKCLFREFA